MIPSNWKEISVNQFIELRSVSSSTSDSITEKHIDLLLTVTDLDLEVIEEMSSKELTKHVKSLSWTRKEPHKKYAKKISEFEIIPFNKITWGMFIDLEYYYSKDYIENICTICGILYRKQSNDEWENNIIEPYIYDPKTRGNLFKHLPITTIYGVVSDYLDYRNSLVEGAYVDLFGGMVDDEDEEDLTPQEKAERLKDLKEEEKFNKWAYESVTLNLANNDIRGMKDILNMPLIYVLNMLSMKNDLN